MSLRPVKYDSAKCEQQAKKLWEDFCKHRDTIQKEDPSKDDEMQIYKGWSVQIIANLQLAVFDLFQEVQDLTLAIEAKGKK